MQTATSVPPAAAAPASDASAAQAAATPHDTLTEMTKRAGRGYTVVRNSFVQRRQRDGSYAGSTLGRLVHARQHRAVLAYLLVLAMEKPLERFGAPLEAQVWARALSPDPPEPPLKEARMTPVWSNLAQEGLILKERRSRLVKITPRREDGQADYSRPRPDQHPGRDGEKYFTLPDVFWLDGWHNKLSLPGVAALLIVLQGTQTRDEVHLNIDKATDWYGISPRTMFNGLEELRRHCLISCRRDWVPAPLSGIGRTRRDYYSLLTPFSKVDREGIQAEATKATKKRTAMDKKAGRRKKRAPNTSKSAPNAVTTTNTSAAQTVPPIPSIQEPS